VKVLLVTGSLAPLRCGVGDYTLRLAQALAATPGIEVGVLTSKGAAADDTGAIKVFPVMERWGLGEAATFNLTMKQWSPDVVHIQYPTQGYGKGMLPTLIPLLASRFGARVVRTWHEIPVGHGLLSFLVEAIAPGPYVVVREGFLRGLNPLVRPLLKGRAGGLVISASSIPRSVASDEDRRTLRARLLNGKGRLVVFFGFLYPFKGVELLFEIADPALDQIVIAGEAGVDERYYSYLERRANEVPWRESVTMAGYLSDRDTADLLAAADAVILPFRGGGGAWNSSIQAAVLQGTAVITTSRETQGLDERRNVYFAAPEDVPAMKAALDQLAGRKRAFDPEIDQDEWRRIADQHHALYKSPRTTHLPENGPP